MQLDTAPMRLGDPLGQRIVGWVGRTALLAGEVLRPRLEPRRIDCISARAHLQDQGVQPQLGGAIDDGEHLRALLRRAQVPATRPVDVRDRRNPGSAEFARRRRRLDLGRRDGRAARDEGNNNRGQTPFST